ncbi:Ninja-family protein AFP3 [Vitis vinifera]|uniref:Ninja-family protein n=1 Tax=Vitis vinifera TaxID=29760 RepID=A0A438DJA9_VITVI|nr:Ninja-family protein AFP3 [Vitis vinifera]
MALHELSGGARLLYLLFLHLLLPSPFSNTCATPLPFLARVLLFTSVRCSIDLRILRGVANEVIAPSSLDGPLPNPHRPARSERCWNLITYQLPACRELFHIHFEPGSPCGCHVLNQWNKFLFTEIAQERGEYVAVNGRVGSGVNGTRWSSFSVVKFFCLCWFRFSFGYGDFLLTTQFFSDKRSDCFHFRRTQNKALFRVLASDSSVSMAGTSKDGMYGIHDYFMQSDERQKNGAGDSVSDSGCNLELTLGGSYGNFDDEMPVLTLSSAVFESDTMEEDSGEPNVPPPAEFAVEGSFLSLGMSLPPPVLEMKTMKELQTMRRQEVKKRLMGKNRNRGRPPLPNQSQTRVLLPAVFQLAPPSKTVPPSSPPLLQPQCPTPMSFRLPTPISPPLKPSSPPLSPTPLSFYMPPPPPTPSTSSPPLSPRPLSFRLPTPMPPPPPPPPPQHSSLPLCPMPLSIIPPHRQSSSPPLSPIPLSFRLPLPAPHSPSELSPLVSDPAPLLYCLRFPLIPIFQPKSRVTKWLFQSNSFIIKLCEFHIVEPESLPVDILRALVVRWLLQHKYKRPRASDRSDRETGLELIKQMPTVVTTGAGPNGKRIEGFLYKFGTGQISLVCICHGMFFTPAEFVRHAGGDDVENPMKQIIVCPASF